MSTYKADALVIRSREYKESDRIITLYSREHGKIGAVSKGARKSTSTQRGGVQLYTYTDFVLYKGRSLDTIQQAHPREVFLYLWDDYERSCAAACMAELLDAGTPEGEGDEGLFIMSLKFLFMLEGLDPLLAVTLYGLRFMAKQGYLPEGGDLSLQKASLSEGTRQVLRRLYGMSWEQVERLRISASQRWEIGRALQVFCEHKLDRRLRAWRSFVDICGE